MIDKTELTQKKGALAELFCSVAGYLAENYVEQAENTVLYQAPVQIKRAASDSVARVPMASKASSLEEMLRQTDAGFTETLLEFIDRSGRKDSEIYNKAGISRQHFCKIRSNPGYRPTKATAIAFAIALELDLEQTRDLIGRAGYALTNSSKFDVIIRYFLERKQYDLSQINATLFEFDQTLLGSSL